MENLNFVLMGNSLSGLTQIWNVESAHTGIGLGSVKWYAPWRRYAFYPSPALFDSACLQEVARFLDGQMTVRAQDRLTR